MSTELLVGAAVVLQLIILAVVLLRRPVDPAAQVEAAMQRVRDELQQSRGEQQRTAGDLRNEINARLDSQITALQRGLGFVPLAQEHYRLVCLKSALDSPAVLALRDFLATPEWRQQLASWMGYADDQGGEVQSLRDLFP